MLQKKGRTRRLNLSGLGCLSPGLGWDRIGACCWELGTGTERVGSRGGGRGEHVQVGEAGKINNSTRVRGGCVLRPEAEVIFESQRATNRRVRWATYAPWGWLLPLRIGERTQAGAIEGIIRNNGQAQYLLPRHHSRKIL